MYKRPKKGTTTELLNTKKVIIKGILNTKIQALTVIRDD